MNLRWSKTFGHPAGSSVSIGCNLGLWMVGFGIAQYQVTYEKNYQALAFITLTISLLCFSVSITNAQTN